jgi:hypothetical protein
MIDHGCTGFVLLFQSFMSTLIFCTSKLMKLTFLFIKNYENLPRPLGGGGGGG